MDSPTCLSALTIAGSDSGGGAGIQADLKTFAAHRVHGLSAITALTAQHTRGVVAVDVPALEFLRAQLDACFDDFEIGAVKLGMLANAGVIGVVADAMSARRPPFLVVDPVMVATSGAKLLEEAALDALRRRLIPLASVLTPNLPEAELLLGRRIDSLQAMHAAADGLLSMGAASVLLKGGHLAGEGDVVDLFADAHGRHEIAHPRLRGGYRPGRSEVLVLDHFGAAPSR
ncbi:MAG: bifunctional hydroxymethylpyrimidine kinase/phosphomethylpyrimidine kinase [Lysobacteraceae bacterium]|nr:MAG: bifunctional hydroxymethylpyrimidine kinase/phosphomethylpyrimidine kinase [Xanthomonadaceae bacterium]